MLVLALAFAALAATASATGYIEGREYVYEYKGQIYSGYPRIKPQYAGYAFHANVYIQPHGDYALLRVDDVEKTKFNGDFEHISHHPFKYEGMPGHADFLKAPFKVYRKDGIVTHFEVNKGEPMFSVNLKRGLIALFNLNFEGPDASHSTEDNDIVGPEHDEHYYKVYEKGVLGDCETAYVIEHHPYWKTPHNNIVLNVTKVRNYHKCHSTPNHVYSTFHGRECGEADHEKSHTLHGNAHFYYKIRGHRHNYVIETIKSVGETAYTPYPIEGQTVATYINRVLKLKEEHPVTTPMEMTEDLENHDSLEFEFEHQHDFQEAVDLKKSHFLFHILGRKVPLDAIKSQFEELVEVYHDDTYHEKMKDKNFPAKFVELLRSFGTIDYNEIEELFKAYGDVDPKTATPEQKRNRNLFVDTLVASGTNPAFEFGKHLVETKKFTKGEAAHFLGQFPMHIKEVSKTILDELESLCENSNVKKVPNLHIACVFALSNIVHDHCVARYHPELPPATDKHGCQPDDAVKYFDYIAKNYASAEGKLKVAYIKAAGNIGVKDIIPYLKPYVEGHGKIHRYYRVNAIWALKNVGVRYPDKVKNLLVPLLFNHTENYEVRIAAYSLMTIFRPQLYEFEGLARALKKDPDDQLKSYIYSHLSHVANSTHPCDRKIAQDAHYAMRLLDDGHHHFDYDYSYSKHHYVAGYDHDYDFGGSTRFAYLASDSGYIPRTVYLGLEDYIGGKSFESLGVGFKQYGLEKFFDQLIGPEGSFGKRSLFDLFKKRAKRETSGVEKELNEIKGKIDLPTIDYEHIHAELFFKYMGNHVSFLSLDDHSFEDFFREGRFSIPNIPAAYQKIPEFFYQRFLLTIDKFYVIPSESGIPLFFDYKQPFYYFHHNKESSFKVEPGFFPEDRGGKFPDHVKFSHDGHFAIDKNLFASLSALIPFDQVIFGAGINRRATVSLPLDVKLDLDVQKKQLNFKWHPVAPHEIYHFKYEPFTYVDSYANTVPKVLEEGYHPVRRAKGEQHEFEFLHDALGVGFDVSAYYENEFNHEGNWLDFLFQKDYREKFYYLYANPHFEPYFIDVEFTHAKEGATKEVETTLTFKNYESDHHNEDFAKEGFEDFKKPSDRDHPVTCALEYELHATGDKERTLRWDLEWTRDLKRTYHRLNFFYDRSPFASHETDHLKVCGSSYLKYPNYDLTKLATLETKEMDHTVHMETKQRFGKDCSSHQKLDIHTTVHTSDEQKYLDAHREDPDTPEHYNPYSHYFHKCQEERQRGINYGENCIHYMELVTTAYSVEHHAKFENLSPRFLNMTYKIGGFLRHTLYNFADHNVLDVHNPDGEIRVHANYSIHLPLADIEVHKPHSTSHYTNVYVPGHVGFRTYPPFEDMHVKNSFTELHCRVEGDHVYTFDKYEYTLPPIDCYKVIARDCSKKELFTVLASKITHPKYHKALKVFIEDHKVEVLPVSDDSDLIIRVDGKRVSVTQEDAYVHDDEQGHHDFYITKRSFYYALHSEKFGLIVNFDGHVIVVHVSPYYRAKMCGLCGNYNGQKYDGLEDENHCYYEDESAYAYAYTIPTDTCHVPKSEKKCPAEGGFGCTKLRTKIIEREGAKGTETCFSNDPVSECAPHCKARSTSSDKVTFHCLPQKDDSTKALVRQQQHRVIHEVKRKSHDYETTVDVPDVCLKN